jgi:hypothetical protein
MGWGQIAGAVIGAKIGGDAQSKAAREAAAANLEQQKRALAFQREMNQESLAQLEGGYTDLQQLGRRMAIQGMGQVTANLMGRGINPASTMGLNLQRGMLADVNYKILDDSYMRARDRAAIFQNQEFPMVMQEGPQGNWASDYAALGMALGKAFTNDGDD